MGPLGSAGPDTALRIYLQDHHAGAMAGLALARRTAANHGDSPVAEELRAVVGDLEHNEEVLRQVMDRLQVEPAPWKDLGGKLLERAGRLKLNGQLTGTSPLSPVIELEGLLSGVKSQQHLWILLRDAVEQPIGVDPDDMLARTEDLRERLHALWLQAARDAFGTREHAS